MNRTPVEAINILSQKVKNMILADLFNLEELEWAA